MRELEVECPNCGSDYHSHKKNDTVVGIMDELTCGDCETKWTMISTVQTYFIQFKVDK